jgi:predicted nuclease with TOPRIM domain
LIVHGSEGITVRRWGGETTLNEVPFDEAPLKAGDCLRIAGVELDVIAPAAASTPTKPSPRLAAGADSSSRFRAGRDAARQRSRQLLDALRRARAEHDHLLQRTSELQQQSEQTAAQLGRLAAEHEKTLADLAEVRRQMSAGQGLADQNNRLVREVRELTERADQLGGELASLAADKHALEVEKAAFDEERRRLLDENSQFRDRLRDQQTQLAQQVAALRGEADQLREQDERLKEQIRTLGVEKAALEDERASGQTEHDTLRRQHEKLQADWQSLASADETLAQERTALCRERDELRNEIDRVRADIQSLAADRDAQDKAQAELCGERDAYRRQCEELRQNLDALSAEKTALAEERGVLSGECVTLRGQNQELQETNSGLLAEKSAAADEHAAACTERDQLREENQQLQAAVAELDEEVSAFAAAKSALEEERDRLREENKRLAEIEQEMRAAVAERENMSAELYRALLQAAEMQKHADEYDALLVANQALRDEHEELTARIAHFQKEVERLNEEQFSAVASQQSLADEATEIRQDRQRLSEENAQLLASLSEARQQLEEAARRQAEGTDPLLQENASLRKQLEDAQRDHSAFAETVSAFERQLAGTHEEQAAVEAAMEEANRHIADQAARLAESAGSIERLEEQLAAAQNAHQSLEDERDDWQQRCAATARQHEEQRQRIAELEARLAAAVATPPPRAGDRPADAPSVDEMPPAGDPAQPIAVSEIASTGAETAGQASKAAAISLDNEDTEPALPQVSADGPCKLEQEPPQASSAPVKQEFQPTSYIERYSHLFADDEAVRENSPKLGTTRPLGDGGPKPGHAQAQRESTATTHASSSGDEESIEQYMNQLLQRVRGQSAGPVASQAPQTPRTIEAKAQPRLPAMQPAGTASEPGLSPANPFAWAPNFGTARPKSSTPAPKTDLEALRALANESARRAISRHALRKLRRNALTKAIVATLAGVTSLWLILESADWRSLQCITAGVALLVAAYWTGQTYRTLLQSLRERAYDDVPEDEVEQPVASFHSPLPIDVERPVA